MKNIIFVFVSLLFFTNIYGQTAPAINGKILYHSYSGYENWDSELFILDLSDNSVTNISSGWNIDHEMNGVFSPDGTKIVFMGDKRRGQRNWDIFLWNVGGGEPVNLTNGGGRDEDPKFSPDGTKIVYKSDNDIKEMDLTGAVINNVTNTPSIEESMPYYTTDGAKILYAPGAGAGSDIYSINIDGTNSQALVAQANYQEYYPVVRDDLSFFYTGWVSTTDVHDQLYLKYFADPNPVYLPFNNANADYSDATPVGAQYVVLSSTRAGGDGGYDLYIADISTGSIWSLDDYNSNVNSGLEDLGANYYIGSSGPSNNSPSVSIVSPNDNASYNEPAVVVMDANATDSDGTIAKVEFYQNGNLLGEDITSPYSFSWNNVSTGTYTLQAIATDDQGATGTSSTVNISVTGTSGCTVFTLPGTIEAEDYCDMSGVVTETCYDTGGGLDVGGVVKNDWMEYEVNVGSSGSYTVTYRVATTENASKIQIQEDGNVLATTTVPNTGGWQNWQSVSTTISLSAGLHTLKIIDTRRSWNLNWISFMSNSGQKVNSLDSKQAAAPVLEGKILYHTYSGYENWDGELFILDLSDNSITNISENWSIDHAINGMFSPDGTKIVFMGDGHGWVQDWDIFLWTIGEDEPVNLTGLNQDREEDPKFSPDGNTIVYKKNGDIVTMDLEGNFIANLTNTAGIEESMPYYSADGSEIF